MRTIIHDPEPEFLRGALAGQNLKAGTLIRLGDGAWDFGAVGNLVFPGGVELEGNGRLHTFLRNAYAGDMNLADGGPAFQFGHQAACRGVALQSTCRLDQQAAAAGPIQDASMSDGLVVFEECGFSGRAWCFLNWGAALRVRVRSSFCTFLAGRWVIAAAVSSGANAQFFDFYECHVHGRPALSDYVGAVGFRVIGVACRGGLLRFFGGSINVLGDQRMEHVSALWNGHNGSTRARVEAYGVACRVLAGGAKAAWDINNEVPGASIRTFGGTGSGAGGAFTENLAPPPPAGQAAEGAA